METQFPPQSEKVKLLIQKICQEQNQPPISKYAQQLLSAIGDENALAILNTISAKRIIKTFDGFIIHLVKKDHSKAISNIYSSPTKRPFSPPFASPFTSPPPSKRRMGSLQSPMLNSQINPTISTLPSSDPHHNITRHLSFEDEPQQMIGPIVGQRLSHILELTDKTLSQQMKILSALEFRKLFLVLNYIEGKKLEDVISVDCANDILSKKDLTMSYFESQIWDICKNTRLDRRQYFDWDSDKTHLYHLIVYKDGSYLFKGPYLDSTKTHLQRSLGDDNVLIVKFSDKMDYTVDSIVDKGLFVGLRHYRFYVFKGERKKVKKNQTDEEKQASSSIKCYFACTDFAGRNENLRGKSISTARSLFMHVHTVKTLEKYMARFSLILSKTIKLQIDLSACEIQEIDDICFIDENGSLMFDEDNKPLIHTDGTGFISEDLAMMCPKDFSAAMHIKDNNSFEKNNDIVGFGEMHCQERGPKARNNEPPLLMQCRLFYYGCAVKGTFLVNKKLGPKTIQVRPSMIKVTKDEALANEETFNSLEIVDISRKPGRTSLSKHLIALLSYGGVPKEFFLNLLTDALEDNIKAYSNKRAALKVAINHDGLYYGLVAERMISSGIPLNEPYLQYCLSILQRDGYDKLKAGKIPIKDSFYLMGTADPTGVLNYDEVSVILENGQISGKVLVYRHPGLHFGDIHVMNAVYVKELEEFVGNSKYGVFFSSKGGRSASYEMATGDFDGDMYWISKNPELLRDFTASEPYKRVHMTKDSDCRTLPDSPYELECRLFRLFLQASTPSYAMANASYSWLSYMDRLLILGDNCASEKDGLKEKMYHLIDIYYDALDAPKSGKRVNIPNKLLATLFPHHMGRDTESSYHSTSILGQIHDIVDKLKDDPGPKQEITKLPLFEVEVPTEYLDMWRDRYDEYRREMTKAMGLEFKNDAANEVIKKYKKLLYDAADLDDSTKNIEVIYEEALAIYHVTYDYAARNGDITKCNFTWKVAGSALCGMYAWTLASNSKEIPMLILPSVLRDVLN